MSDPIAEATDKFMLAVGRGLQAWSGVELMMSSVFIWTSGTDHARSLMIFDTIISFETRLAVLNKVVIHALKDDPDLAVWVKLVACLSKNYKRRHEIAHFKVVTRNRTVKDMSNTTVVFMPFLTMQNMATGKQKELSILDIEERTKKFTEIEKALGHFMGKFWLGDKNERPGVPVPHLIHHFRRLVAQNLAAQ